MNDKQDTLAEFRAQVRAQRTPLPRQPETDDLVVREKDLVWFDPADNPTRLAPVLGTPIKSFELFLQEFAPGGSSDMQRHHHEAVHYVLAGSGYSEIGDRRYPWAAGDFVSVPPMMWHRHYNGSETEPNPKSGWPQANTRSPTSAVTVQPAVSERSPPTSCIPTISPGLIFASPQLRATVLMPEVAPEVKMHSSGWAAWINARTVSRAWSNRSSDSWASW